MTDLTGWKRLQNQSSKSITLSNAYLPYILHRHGGIV
jgi:hypothetical protein